METPPLLMGMQTHEATFEISMAVSQKIQNQPTSLNHTTLVPTHSGYTTIPQGHSLLYVHSSIIYNSHNLETP